MIVSAFPCGAVLILDGESVPVSRPKAKPSVTYAWHVGENPLIILIDTEKVKQSPQRVRAPCVRRTFARMLPGPYSQPHVLPQLDCPR